MTVFLACGSEYQFFSQQFPIKPVFRAAIRYHEVDLLQGKEVVEKALAEFCAVAKKNVQLGFAEKARLTATLSSLSSMEPCSALKPAQEKRRCPHSSPR